MQGERRNLELKAVDRDPERSLRVCAKLGAEDAGALRQRDTYFTVPHGRLKLRREGNGTAHLIAYERSDDPGQRESRYRIVEVEDDRGLEAALAAGIGIDGSVSKTRRLYLYRGVRIHLDAVDGLGAYIEFEGVAAPGISDLSDFERLLSDLRRAFGIEDADLIGKSYRELMLARR
jgi:predicted adenylyl cyclase CyaB